jgi:uncharacterized protein (DUF427 family)
MARAEWNGVVIAEELDASKLENVEGNVYFPAESVNFDLLKKTTHTSVCPWKGTSNYYSVEVNGKTNENCIWVYDAPKDAAKQLKDRCVSRAAAGMPLIHVFLPPAQDFLTSTRFLSGL